MVRGLWPPSLGPVSCTGYCARLPNGPVLTRKHWNIWASYILKLFGRTISSRLPAQSSYLLPYGKQDRRVASYCYKPSICILAIFALDSSSFRSKIFKIRPSFVTSVFGGCASFVSITILSIFSRKPTLPTAFTNVFKICATSGPKFANNRMPPASQALVTSQSGPFASRAFTTIPYTNDFAYPSHLFRILLLRRLRLPLPLFARTCRCRRTFDSLGDHRAACAQSGALRSRGRPLERAAARVCREAGARVTTHTRLADLNVQHVHHIDDRRIEVIANGLALWGVAQLAVDTTLVSPLTRAGEPRCTLHDARKAKERACPELLRNSRCCLVVLGIEVGGRWSEEAASFITNLARAKTRDTPAPLRHAATASLISRWTAFLTHAAFTAFAASLLFEDPTHHHNLDRHRSHFGSSHFGSNHFGSSNGLRTSPCFTPRLIGNCRPCTNLTWSWYNEAISFKYAYIWRKASILPKFRWLVWCSGVA